MKASILLIEDDSRIAEIITEYLERESDKDWQVTWASYGKDGIRQAQENKYDLLLLDVMLPDISGFQVCKKIRNSSDITIIFITARTREEDVLEGYAQGGDDYIVKPFSLAQLYAKIGAIIRRRNEGKKTLITIGNLSMNLSTCEVSICREKIPMPLKEYAILEFLMQHPKQVVERNQLIVHAWDWDSDVVDRVVDNHIKNLRKLISNSSVKIETVHKRGYRLSEKE